jgi:hypothetical protein
MRIVACTFAPLTDPPNIALVGKRTVCGRGGWASAAAGSAKTPSATAA